MRVRPLKAETRVHGLQNGFKIEVIETCKVSPPPTCHRFPRMPRLTRIVAASSTLGKATSGGS